LFIIVFFADQNLVEKFELIATTGKNAKMPIIRYTINQIYWCLFIVKYII